MNGFTNPNNYNYAAGQQNRFDNGKPIMDRSEEYEGFFYAQQDTGDRNKIRNLMTLALDNMHNGSYNNALDLFQELLRLDPENEGANYNAFLCRHKFPDIPTEKADIRTFKNQLLNDQLTDHFFVQAKKYARSDRKKSLNELEWRCREIYRLDEVRDLLRERNVRAAANLLHAIHGWLQNNSRVSLYPDYFQELQSELEYQNNYLTYCQEVGDPGTYIARMMQQLYPQELNTAKKLQRQAGRKGPKHIIIDILFAVSSISACIMWAMILFALLNYTDSAIFKAWNEVMMTSRWAYPLWLAFGVFQLFGLIYVTNAKSVGGVLACLGIPQIAYYGVLQWDNTAIGITISVVSFVVLEMIALGCLFKSILVISDRILSPVRGRNFHSYMSNTINHCEKDIRDSLSNRWGSIIRQEDQLYLTPFSLEDPMEQKGQSARGRADYSQNRKVQTNLQDCYEGDQPYVFISYAHKDRDRVFPIVARLQQSGYRVWLDTNITPGSEWDSEIAQHLFGSSLVIAMLSRNYLNSENCKDELNTARDKNINQLLIYLEAVDLPSGMEMRFGRSQHLVLANYDNNEDFYTRLLRAEGLRPCRGGY